MKNSILCERSYSFALRIVKLCKKLREMREYIFADQILRCGTSIGANLAESKCAQSRADFLAKVSISYKESNECLYWLNLLADSEILSRELLEPLIDECCEIVKMLSATQLTMKKQRE